MLGLPPELLISVAFILFLAIGLHEYAHCKFADMAGDPTPSIYGRVTLNLTKHFEPLGTVMMVLTSITGYGIGWGRPAPMNPDKMRNPRWDFFMAVLAGPVSNVTQAVIYAFLAKLAIVGGFTNQLELTHTFHGDSATTIAMFFIYAIRINVSLALFNLIPLGPLDGHWLLGLIMPERPRLKWFIWNRSYGRGLLILVILGGQFLRQVNPALDPLGNYLFPAVNGLTHYLLGIKG